MTPQAASETVAAKLANVIGSMISSLRSGQDRKYYVGLVQYYIEGIPYYSSGLSVGLDTFACTATFPPEIINRVL